MQREVVCSPGSRNTPLLIAAEARSELKKTVVVDERTAAFIALGKSMVSGKPVALICTSGTAVLNYGPALAEAYYQGVPLIAITADRPAEWIDQDDSQTLRQNEAFDIGRNTTLTYHAVGQRSLSFHRVKSTSAPLHKLNTRLLALPCIGT